MEGYQVLTVEDVVETADIFITTTGNKDVIRIEHMREMKNMAIVGNIGHFDNEIQVAALKNFKWQNVKPQVDMIEFPDGKRMLLLSEGRLVNLAAAEGHPAAVMDMSFANQALAVAYLRAQRLEQGVHRVPVDIDHEVAQLKLAAMGLHIDHLTDEHTAYLATWQEGT